MNEIKPFRGILYNKELIKDLSEVLTPPYDIIDSKMQEYFYNKNEYNFIRIDYGQKFATDNESGNVYTRAKKYFDEWLNKNILVQSPVPAFYILKQDFIFDNKNYEKLGFYGLYRLSDYSHDTIMPHEKTQSGPKEDRFKLTLACNAYFSAIYSVYEDENMLIENIFKNNIFEEIFSFTDYQNVKNTLYLSADNNINEQISKILSRKRLIIADGHHRYETALRVKNELKGKYPDNDSINYALMFFSNLSDPNTLILPTHRLIDDVSFNETEFIEFLKTNFTISFHPKNALKDIFHKIKSDPKVQFICLTKDNLILIEADNKKIEKLFPEDMQDILKNLDVNILFYGILKPALKITEEDLKNQKKVSYCKDALSAMEMVSRGEKTLAFILQNPRSENLKRVIDIKETMPQKSTYFYPKIPSGAVIYTFDEHN
ncbi:MAG: DUF1015 domain-containing protein [Proteobacteria bacterium]|nr:DUF1015 domain-containing protein [Pseudomonadota bacterium]